MAPARRWGVFTQTESPSDGVDGVCVRLWVDDGDGKPEPGDGDALVASTVTADDVYGQAGHYLFDGLIPGLSYFVVGGAAFPSPGLPFASAVHPGGTWP